MWDVQGRTPIVLLLFFYAHKYQLGLCVKKNKNASILVTPEIRRKKKSFNYMYDVLITSETTIALI